MKIIIKSINKMRDWNEKAFYGFFCTAILVMVLVFFFVWFHKS
jgi:hypothetical protein